MFAPYASTNIVSRKSALLTVFALVVLAICVPPRAGAISDDEELTRFGSKGSGAGQLVEPGGPSTDPSTGHVFVSDPSNRRINEFTAWGNFVKAFGWDVAPGAVNEQQEVRLRASAGQFKLSFGASTTTDLAFDAPGSSSGGPESVEAALNALPSIGGAGGEVDVEAVPGAPNGATPYVYVITFKGSLAATDVADIAIANGTTSLSGGDPSTAFEVRTRADGTAGGTGLESCTEESGCKAGIEGSGAGQLSGARGLAIDVAGNVYAKENGNLRVQKFDSAGRFVLMFGGEVNKTTGEGICTKTQLDGGNECGSGVAGGAPGQFSGFSSGLVLGSGDQLFAADNERIQRFNLQGEFEASISVPGEQVNYLAFDPVSEDFYATYTFKEGTPVVVHKLDSTTGAEISRLDGQNELATDSAGNVYVKGPGDGSEREGKIAQYNSNGNPLSPPACCEPPPLPNNPSERFGVSGFGTNTAGNLYVSYSAEPDSFIRLFGPGPVMFEGPPKVPPTIVSQFATSVDRAGAVLGAEINPHFWTDTRFYVQYGTGKCSEGGCVSEKPVSPGALLSTKPTGDEVKSPSVFLEGLKPDTIYHYRFVAESAGGGPVRGVGGEVGVDGEESTFTTYPVHAPKADCPNQGFRTGFSAPLPNCRAYEMVSPIDKNNGDIKALPNVPGFASDVQQSSVDGEKLAYGSYRAFADPKAGGYTMHYLASRKEGVGWASQSINPPQGHAQSAGSVNSTIEGAYRAFSPDLCNGWLLVAPEPALDPTSPQDYRSLYRRDNCGPGGYEGLITAQPVVQNDFQLPNTEFQGASADGKAAILMVRDKLTDDAASGPWQAYYSSGGGLKLLCVLPNGTTSGGHCSGGTNGERFNNDTLDRSANVTNAISADGSRVYWTDTALGDSEEPGPGKVYLRLNPGEEQSEIEAGQCTEPEKACTLKVSETVTSKAARFLMASPDGSRALFLITEGTSDGNLYLFDAETGESALVADDVLGLAGASENLSHVYFASTKALAGTTGATGGRPNLYLDQEGAKTFIATLSNRDADPDESSALSNIAHEPAYHVARVTPDGSALAFVSTEPLTGYDTTDQLSGQVNSQVYLYEAGAPGPVCVSCNPSGSRPLGRRIPGFLGGLFATAASIPPARYQLYLSRALSADGSRLFFDSYDALLPRDTNGKADVYQWEAASSEEACEERGADLFVPSSGGCLSLISSGQSPSDSVFVDASPSGDDVFFTTNASLLPQDPGLIDIYDARANGGLPAPPAPPGPCQGEACQFGAQAPNDPTPASATFRGVGDPKSKPNTRRRCGKGKARRKGRCVTKRKRAKGARRGTRDANANRRASR